MLTLLMNIELWKMSGYDIDQVKSLFPSRSVSLVQYNRYMLLFLIVLTTILIIWNSIITQKIASQKEQLLVQEEYINKLKEQMPVILEQYNTSNNIFKRDSVLFSRDVISENEYELAKSSFYRASSLSSLLMPH